MKTFPTLIVENLGGKTLGNCYYQTDYEVKSLNRMLSTEDINSLRAMGFLGYGQEFKVKWTGVEPADKFNTYYTVVVETRCDSSD